MAKKKPIRDAARRRFRGSCEPCYYFSLLVLVIYYILSPVGASDSDRLLLTKRKSENLKRYEAVVIQKNRRRLGCGEKGEYWKKTSVVGTGYCASCTTGRYSAGKGKDHGLESCKFCSSGQYNPSNMQTSCTSCSPGTFQNEIGQSNCNDCAAGLFQTEAGQSSCFAPECTQINGNEPNNAVCQCGSTTCSSETGFYCTQSTTAFGASTCAAGPFCTQTDGITANPAACTCGTALCSADSGFYCTKSNSTCAAGPPCSQTDGITANSAACICGTALCSATESLCDKSSSTCTEPVPLCNEIDGLSANNAACQCGSTECSADLGYYCTQSTNTCAAGPPCDRTSGITANPAACRCGTTGCSSNTGLYCTSSISVCSPFEPCLINDGTLPNTDSCRCGTTECSDRNTGLYCTSSTSLCSPFEPCLINDGTLPNTDSCSCLAKDCTASNGLICDVTTPEKCSNSDCGGNAIANITLENCKKFNSRCQCSKCKKGFFAKDCSQRCPAPAVAVAVDSTFVFFTVWTTIAYLYYQNAVLEQTETAKETEEAATDTKDEAKDIKEKGSEIAEEGKSTAAGAIIAKQTNAARTKARLFTKKFTQKIKSLQRIIVARMQVLTAIFATIVWSPEILVPKFLLNFLKTIGGFFTFDVPGLLSSPDCVFDAGKGAAMTPIDKWYISLFLPFGLMLLVLIPTFYYCVRHKANRTNKDYVRMADGWNNVCTQFTCVWIFATVVTTGFTILDCDKGMEGRLIMDPDVICPLSQTGFLESITTTQTSNTTYSLVETGTCGSLSGRVDIMDKATCETAASSLDLSTITVDDETFSNNNKTNPPGCIFSNSNGFLYFNTDSSTTSCSSDWSCLCEIIPVSSTNTTDIYDKDAVDKYPALLGILVLLVYCLGILVFLCCAVGIARKSFKERMGKKNKLLELETRAGERNGRKNKRKKKMKKINIEKMDEEMQAEKKKDEEEEEQDQREMTQIQDGLDKYEVIRLVNVRATPDLNGKNIRQLNSKKIVYVSEVAGAWLKIGINEWVLKESDTGAVLKPMTKSIEESDTWRCVGWLMEDYR